MTTETNNTNAVAKGNEMDYPEFKTQMLELFLSANKYTPAQAGFKIFTDRMADLADSHPHYDVRLENE